ncbi:MAG: DNA gyrase subunit A [Bacteroidales bacterium]|nr:DNA gyrase subunit A [Bacteroidales bacterium]MBD5281522.1 DNA gyrase subunit A [Bacteroides sp.]MDE6032528.1 DNA gyrase subunit A [Muribaculaceae bacterium]MBD5294382.1 DNA gyrase subunit A [Bacteroides sp.]MBD5342283.1 DNA gyrase subunit A [Bacteroides sp.]
MQEDRIQRINIESEMKSAYIDYSMSVIVSRALPDVRDGLKPVQRRVLYGMHEMGNTSDRPPMKSANCVGEVMGKYHPHGDSSIYGTVVRMAQDWAMRNILINGKGNFGSIDGDSAAAMRYTEVRLAKMGEEMLADIGSDTVEMQRNYDDKRDEPTVLPTRFPNLLVNGGTGIAVGMATNMPTHNLRESIDASIALLENPEITIEELMNYIPAPDFPTGGIIYGIQGVKDAYETGRGRVIIRSKYEMENEGNHTNIIITEIPYGVNRSDLVKQIAGLVSEKKIDGISDINDESDSNTVQRIVISLKVDANPMVVLNKLFKMSALQSSFAVNNVALVNGRPKTLNLKELLQAFIAHRYDVVIRRTKYELRKAEERAHILEGLIIASQNIDEVIRIIKESDSPDAAREALAERFGLTEAQTQAIVEMRLRQLTGLEQDKLHKNYEEVQAEIRRLHEILDNPDVCRAVIRGELEEVRDKYGDDRRSEINQAGGQFDDDSFYDDDEMVITISHLGYIKRTKLTEFRAQNRGGVGIKGSSTRSEDFIEHIYTANNRSYMLFFTERGRCYWLKVYNIPEAARNQKGRAIQNLLSIESNDSVKAYIAVRSLSDAEFVNGHNLVFCTKKGVIKKTPLEAYSRPRSLGVNAIIIREDDELLQVELTSGNSEIIMANRNGRAIRFDEKRVREMGRMSTGVRGMTLDDEQDEIVGMICMEPETSKSVLVLSENGYGKRSDLDDYRITNRGGKGVKTLNITDKTGKLVAIKSVDDENDLVIINRSGITIRLHMDDIRIMGRATQGVRMINLEKRGDTIASVCVVDTDPDEAVDEQEGADVQSSDDAPATDE